MKTITEHYYIALEDFRVSPKGTELKDVFEKATQAYAVEYARIQIEKDRERVKDQIWHSADIHNTINEVIDNTPIVLD
jgi:hypothetical protein